MGLLGYPVSHPNQRVVSLLRVPVLCWVLKFDTFLFSPERLWDTLEASHPASPRSTQCSPRVWQMPPEGRETKSYVGVLSFCLPSLQHWLSESWLPVSPNVAILFCSLLLFLGSNSDQTSPSACISRLPHAITAQANRQKSDKEFWLPTLVHFLLASVHSSCSCPGSSLMMSYRFF